jgi:hypothetical protein
VSFRSSVFILPIVGCVSNDFAHMQMTQCLVSGSAVDHWQFESVYCENIWFQMKMRCVMGCVSISELILLVSFLVKYQTLQVNT